MKNYKEDLYKAIKVWLVKGSANVRWMASEIIGYYNIAELGNLLPPLYKDKDCHEKWPEWRLNCLWAHSKVCNNYTEMHKFLCMTENPFNQEWLLGAYEQMVQKGHCDVSIFQKRS